VSNTYYAVHSKRGAPDDYPKTMRIDYLVGFNDFRSEWVCPEHTGYAREKFIRWWRERTALGCSVPSTAREAAKLASGGLLVEPESITVQLVAGERFDRITGWCLKARPVMFERGGDSDKINDWSSHDPQDLGVNAVSSDDEKIPF